VRRVLLGAVVVACVACGHASAPAPATHASASGPLRTPTDAGPPDAFEADPLLPANMQPKPPLTYADSVQHVATPTGPIPGMSGMAIVRVTDATRCGREAVLAIFAPTRGDDPTLVLGLASSSPAPATKADMKTWLTSVTDRAVRAGDVYKQRADATTGRDHVEAEARYVQLERHRVDAVLHARPWPGLAQYGFQAYCDGLSKNFEPDVYDADDRAATCRADAAAAGITTGWVLDACRAP
jgi:hypothetical protein